MEPFTTSASVPLASHLRASSAQSCVAKTGVALHCRLNRTLSSPQLKSAHCRHFAVLLDCYFLTVQYDPIEIVGEAHSRLCDIFCQLNDVHLS